MTANAGTGKNRGGGSVLLDMDGNEDEEGGTGDGRGIGDDTLGDISVTEQAHYIVGELITFSSSTKN